MYLTVGIIVIFIFIFYTINQNKKKIDEGKGDEIDINDYYFHTYKENYFGSIFLLIMSIIAVIYLIASKC